MRRILGFAFVFAFAVPLSAQSQQSSGSPVTDMMIRGRNALNDLKYHEADSLARRAI